MVVHVHMYIYIYSVNVIIGMGAIKSHCGDYMECVIFCVYILYLLLLVIL